MAEFQPYPFAFIRGNIVPIEEATVSVMTNALHYGAGVFAGIKAYQMPDGAVGIFRLDDHLKRMKNSCKILRFPFNFDEAAIKSTIVELVAKNKPTGTTYIPVHWCTDPTCSFRQTSLATTI
jgi:branched-chain amino acid aminotransferase